MMLPARDAIGTDQGHPVSEDIDVVQGVAVDDERRAWPPVGVRESLIGDENSWRGAGLLGRLSSQHKCVVLAQRTQFLHVCARYSYGLVIQAIPLRESLHSTIARWARVTWCDGQSRRRGDSSPWNQTDATRGTHIHRRCRGGE